MKVACSWLTCELCTWATQPVGVGDNVFPLWDHPGTGGTGGGPVKMNFASTADSLYSVLYK